MRQDKCMNEAYADLLISVYDVFYNGQQHQAVHTTTHTIQYTEHQPLVRQNYVIP
jgi:hypothetical protein